MNNIPKISHEVPISLLKESLNFNDYQYALPHLLEDRSIYRDHFLWCKENNVEIYLDNSLHELGYALSDDILLKWIDILKPTNFFLPDVWEDPVKTYNKAKIWVDYPTSNTIKIPVIQAQQENDFEVLVKGCKNLGYTKFAFSYGLPIYNKIFPTENIHMGKALGRFKVISNLIAKKIIEPHHKIHLLGCSIPQEFLLYKYIDNIESLDTSNPIMYALEGKIYPSMGIFEKPTLNLNITQDWSHDEISLYLDNIRHNVEIFKYYIK